MILSRVIWRAAVASALVSAVVVVPVLGADPAPGGRFAVHDHDTPGDGWHIELEVSRDGRQARSLVLHSERCNATVFAERLPIGSGGTLDFDRAFTSRGRQGRWRMSGQFTDPRHLTATFQITVGRCDGGLRQVTAHAESHADAGGHEHHTHTVGTAPGAYPDLARATRARRAQAQRLWRATLRSASERFPSYRAALRLGFRRWDREWAKPLIFHLRSTRYNHDRRYLDARRPESLVYWWPVGAEPVLIAFMYRYPLDRRPSFGAPLFGWHTHGARPSNQMTHVWLTRHLRSALANCVPVAALERAVPGFRWSTPTQSGGHNTEPCPEEA